MFNKRISNLPIATELTDNDLFAVLQEDNITRQISFIDMIREVNEIVEISFTDLRILIDEDQLSPGTYYQVEFQTKHLIPNTAVINTGIAETLLLYALSENQISRQVLSIDYAFDILLFDINSTLCEDGATPRDGKITYRKDTIKNLETWYDFRNVKFRRWQIDVASNSSSAWAASTAYAVGNLVYDGSTFYRCMRAHTSSAFFDNANWQIVAYQETSIRTGWNTSVNLMGTTINTNAGIYTDCLTFEQPYCQDVSIKPMYDGSYNNIVFISNGYVRGVSFGENCRDITVMGACSEHTIGKNCHSLILGYSSASNNIGDNCSQLYIINSSSYNSLANGCIGITLINNAIWSTLGENVLNSYIDSSNYVTFKKASYNNKVSYGAHHSEVGNTSNGNIFTNGSIGNVIGQSCANNICTNSSHYNEIGDGSNANTVTNGTTYSKIGKGSTNNLFDGSPSYNEIGNNSHYNTIAYSATRNKIGNGSGSSGSGNVINNSSTSNIIGDNCLSNTLTNSSYYNIIGDYSQANQFTNGAQHNMVGNNSNANQFTNSASYNTVRHNCNANLFTNSSSNNTIGDYSGSNQFNSAYYNTLGTYCTSNILTSASSNSLGNECSTNTLSGGASHNSLGNDCDNNTINSSNANSFGNKCNNNNVGATSYGGHNNSFGNDCDSNNLWGGNSNNSLGNGCVSNNFGTGASNNILGNYCVSNLLSYTSGSSSGSFSNNRLESGCTNIHLLGSNLIFAEGCNTITLSLVCSNCYFAPGLMNKTFSNVQSNCAFMISDVTVKTYANAHTDIIADMKSPDGEIWFKTIDNAGAITTAKLA